MLEIGIKGLRECVVTENLTALKMKSGTLSVFATPAMAALMEETAYKSVEEFLGEGEGTVGSALNITHSSPSPIGAKITCESTLTGIEGKKLVFHVIAKDEAGIIGEGEHIRFIINSEKFMQKALLKNGAYC